MKIKKFEEIEVWKEARKLVTMVYELTNKPLFKRDFGLKEQIQRAAVSCMSNIAEGFDGGTNQQFIQYLVYTRRSSSEVQSELYVALDRKYITQNDFDTAYAQASKVGRLANGFISYLRSATGKPENRQTGKPANQHA